MRNSVFHQSGGDDRDNGEERTQCVLCDGWFLSTNGLNSHMKVHKVTKCGDCEVEFETHGRYTFHRATEHGKRAKCLICIALMILLGLLRSSTFSYLNKPLVD